MSRNMCTETHRKAAKLFKLKNCCLACLTTIYYSNTKQENAEPKFNKGEKNLYFSAINSYPTIPIFKASSKYVHIT